jgi:hypothetical protein
MFKLTFDQALLILLVIIIAIIIWFFLSGTVKFYNECDEASEIKRLTFHGAIVDKKDSDPHFRDRSLIIKTTTNIEHLNLLHDKNINKQTGRSLTWEQIDVGDSIIKESNSFKINYKKPDKEWQRIVLGYKLCK